MNNDIIIITKMSEFDTKIVLETEETSTNPVDATSDLDDSGSQVSSGPNYTQPSLIEITNESVALNVIVSFLNIAQKRGAFTIDESAKIWECIQKFMKKQ